MLRLFADDVGAPGRRPAARTASRQLRLPLALALAAGLTSPLVAASAAQAHPGRPGRELEPGEQLRGAEGLPRRLPAGRRRRGRPDRGQRRRPRRRGPGRRRPADRPRARSPARRPALARDTVPAGARDVVIVGTIGRSPLIDRLIARGQARRRARSGASGRPRWRQVVDDPLPGVRPRLRDRRQRPARHHLRRRTTCPSRHRRLPLALLGRRPGRPPRRAVRAAGPPHPGHARR